MRRDRGHAPGTVGGVLRGVSGSPQAPDLGLPQSYPVRVEAVQGPAGVLAPAVRAWHRPPPALWEKRLLDPAIDPGAASLHSSLTGWHGGSARPVLPDSGPGAGCGDSGPGAGAARLGARCRAWGLGAWCWVNPEELGLQRTWSSGRPLPGEPRGLAQPGGLLGAPVGMPRSGTSAQC